MEELTIISFEAAAKWREWLEENFSQQKGIWLRFYKKGSGIASVYYPEALDEALCFGWIDGQIKSYDPASYIQRFTPRRPRSNWSQRNTEHAERLIESGKMRPPGMAEIEKAKADGRWNRAYSSPGSMKVPEDFLQEISKYKKAKDFFETLDKTNLYTIGYRLQTAKDQEQRIKRMTEIIEMMAKNQKFH